MSIKYIVAFTALLFTQISYCQIVSPTAPNLPKIEYDLNNIPESEINVPIQIDLRPFYNLANKQVDTLFTSPNYPNEWVTSGCDTRYKYSFRRSPLKFDLQGTKLNISFTGYYKIIGATRACVNGTAISPWTPECKCGFEEGERRVNVSFSINIFILTNYQVRMQVIRNEPIPIDKCTVCFWGQDITSSIIDALRKELDASKAQLEKNYGSIDLKPQFQKFWNTLSALNFVNFGWLQINPQKIRVNKIDTKGSLLALNVGLSAKPIIAFEKPSFTTYSPIPNISKFSRVEGFNMYVDAALQYDSLSVLLNQQIAGKEFTFNKAFIRKKFVFQECSLQASNNDKIVIKIKFTGTDHGFFYVTCLPIYNATTQHLELTQVAFDIKSKDALLKAADWLFSKKITNEIEKVGKYDLRNYITDIKNNLNQQINREFMKGIRGNGAVTEVGIAGFFPNEKYLLVRAYGKGSFGLKVNAVDITL